uniref:Uncharacterized protein n=1 Tax=Panagrolaimus sp. JU765 TaxID=591449 RepID=A0AC34QKZ8_9BILA
MKNFRYSEDVTEESDPECFGDSSYERVKTNQILCKNRCFLKYLLYKKKKYEVFFESDENYEFKLVKVGQKITKTKISYNGLKSGFEIYRQYLVNDTIEMLMKTSEEVYAGFLDIDITSSNPTLNAIKIGKIGLSDAKLDDSGIVAVRANGATVEKSVLINNKNSGPFLWKKIHGVKGKIRDVFIQQDKVYLNNGTIEFSLFEDSLKDITPEKTPDVLVNDGKDENVKLSESSTILKITYCITALIGLSIVAFTAVKISQNCSSRDTIVQNNMPSHQPETTEVKERRNGIELANLLPRSRNNIELVTNGDLGSSTSFVQEMEKQQRKQQKNQIKLPTSDPNDFLTE